MGCVEGKAADTVNKTVLGKVVGGRAELKCRLLILCEEETTFWTAHDDRELESTVRAEVTSRRATNCGWCVNTN